MATQLKGKGVLSAQVLYILPILLLLATAGAQANSIEVVDLGDESLNQRYHQLALELRCLVCQNQNLAESDAELAGDLRLLVQEQLLAGSSDEEIIGYLVARYGEFVHYKPSFAGANLLVWLLPVAFLILGLGVWLRQQRWGARRT